MSSFEVTSDARKCFSTWNGSLESQLWTIWSRKCPLFSIRRLFILTLGTRKCPFYLNQIYGVAARYDLRQEVSSLLDGWGHSCFPQKAGQVLCGVGSFFLPDGKWVCWSFVRKEAVWIILDVTNMLIRIRYNNTLTMTNYLCGCLLENHWSGFSKSCRQQGFSGGGGGWQDTAESDKRKVLVLEVENTLFEYLVCCN